MHISGSGPGEITCPTRFEKDWTEGREMVLNQSLWVWVDARGGIIGWGGAEGGAEAPILKPLLVYYH